MLPLLNHYPFPLVWYFSLAISLSFSLQSTKSLRLLSHPYSATTYALHECMGGLASLRQPKAPNSCSPVLNLVPNFQFFFFGQFKIFIDYRKQIVKGEQPSNTNTPTVEEALQEGKANSAHMQEKKNYRKSVKQQLSVFLITRPSNIKNNILYNLMTRSNSLIENLVVSLLPNTIDCLCKAHGI